MMDFKRPLFFICLAVAGLSLMVSLSLTNRALLGMTALIPAAAMTLARKPSLSWLAHLSLLGFVGLSAAGVVLGMPLLPMALAATSSLAGWDLLLEIHPALSYDRFEKVDLYDSLHLKSLGAAVGLGLLGIGLGQWIHWRVPFVGMLVLVIGILFCLERVTAHARQY